jgi:hypothetical protein
MKRIGYAALAGSAAVVVHCGGDVAHLGAQRGADDGGGNSVADAAPVSADAAPVPLDGAPGPSEGGTPVPAAAVIINETAPRLREGNWSVNYWMWSPTYGDDLPGTEGEVAALTPRYLRVGGYNNDANTPDPFDSAQLDTMVAYARTIGAEPILQVPLLANTSGATPTAADAAAMVTYANGTRGYKIKYFSIGNEPDLYATQGLPSDSTLPAIPGYTPAQYCATARDFVTQMKAAAMAADSSTPITIVGPDLAYQYQPPNDWLSPILENCGDLFDVVSIHRYPFSSAMATLPAAAADPARFRSTIASVRNLMSAANVGSKPLALTEMNIVYDATTTVLGASPGTVPSALWLADILGSAMELDLWTSAVWDISDPDSWSLGLIGLPPTHTPRPEYYAYQLYAQYFGPYLVAISASPTGVAAHATRNAADDGTDVILSNWTSSPQPLVFEIVGSAKAISSAPVFTLPSLSLAAVEIPTKALPPQSSTVKRSAPPGRVRRPFRPAPPRRRRPTRPRRRSTPPTRGSSARALRRRRRSSRAAAAGPGRR